MIEKTQLVSLFFFIFSSLLALVASKIHHLDVKDDARTVIELTNFGYLMQGTMNVAIHNFTVEFPEGDQRTIHSLSNNSIFFTLSKGDEVPEFVRTTPSGGGCLLWKRWDREKRDLPVVYFMFDFKGKKVIIDRHGADLAHLEITTAAFKAYHDSLPKASTKPHVAKNEPPAQKEEGKTRKPRRVERGPVRATVRKEEDKQKLKDTVFQNENPETEVTSGRTPAGKQKTSPASSSSSSSSAASVQGPNGGQDGSKGTGTEGKSQQSSSKITMPYSQLTTVSTPQVRMVRGRNHSHLPLLTELPLKSGSVPNSVNTRFAVTFFDADEEGEYYFIYHNCDNYGIPDFNRRLSVSFTIDIEEKNLNSYLGAGDMPKPSLYFGLSLLFCATGLVWIQLMRGTREKEVYRVHYLMAALVFIKSLSLFFHGVNFYFISLYGRQQEVWAVVYYIMHLLKGALLFGTIILIGTGYTFFKNFLTERDRKLFMIIIPLQVLDNVALVITEEGEEGQKNYQIWSKLFIFIDLICCLAIILPVIWSIRHLQEASRTDGKAAFNLEKLQLFRHFYILIICYVYMTRIIKYLVVFTAPFKYQWLVVVVVEVGTWLFFVVTGYKFKPAPNNPYLKLSQSDDELDMEEPVTQSGVLEGVTKLKRGSSYVDTSKGSPEGEDLLGEDVLFEKKARLTSTTPTSDDGAGPDIY